MQLHVRKLPAIHLGCLSPTDRVPARLPVVVSDFAGSTAVQSLSDELGECVELILERGRSSELDVLLVAHLDQEGFHPRETLRDGLHNGGHDRTNASTARVVSRHSGHCTCTTGLPAVLFCTLAGQTA